MRRRQNKFYKIKKIKILILMPNKSTKNSGTGGSTCSINSIMEYPYVMKSLGIQSHPSKWPSTLPGESKARSAIGKLSEYWMLSLASEETSSNFRRFVGFALELRLIS